MRPTTILYTILLLAAPAFTFPLHLDAIASLARRQTLDLVEDPTEIDTSIAITPTFVPGPPRLGLNRVETASDCGTKC